jgi:hypothetical protein
MMTSAIISDMIRRRRFWTCRGGIQTGELDDVEKGGEVGSGKGRSTI